MRSRAARVLLVLLVLPCQLFALFILLIVEAGPCPKPGTPEYFTQRKAPGGEKLLVAAMIAAPAAAGIALLASSWKGITQDPPRG